MFWNEYFLLMNIRKCLATLLLVNIVCVATHAFIRHQPLQRTYARGFLLVHAQTVNQIRHCLARASSMLYTDGSNTTFDFISINANFIYFVNNVTKQKLHINKCDITLIKYIYYTQKHTKQELQHK